MYVEELESDLPHWCFQGRFPKFPKDLLLRRLLEDYFSNGLEWIKKICDDIKTMIPETAFNRCSAESRSMNFGGIPRVKNTTNFKLCKVAGCKYMHENCTSYRIFSWEYPPSNNLLMMLRLKF